MAVVLMEGFDLYNGEGTNVGLQSKWTKAGAGVFSMVTGRFGGQGVTAAGNQGVRASRTLGAGYATFSFGIAVRINTMPLSATLCPIIAFDSAGTFQVGLRVTTGGLLEAFRLTGTAAGTSLGVSSSGMILGTWHYLEGEITISDTVGVFKTYIDNAQVINLTAQDTRNGSPTTIDTINFGIGETSGSSNYGSFSFDDLYVTDSATKLGERKIETIYPTSDVAQGFARSAGTTNYTLVDEATVNGDTDYVQGSTVGDVDTYGLGNLTSTPTTIDAVQVMAFAEKTDAGSRSIALQVKSGATTSDGANFPLAASYTKLERMLLTDPNTAAAWTLSGVNALQGGPKVTV